MLEYIILGFLLYGDMTGYDIKRFMGESTVYFYDASFGSIYPALKRMEESGMIASAETVEGGKYKKLYSLNEKGRALFFDWLEKPIEFKRASHDFLVKFFFLGFLPLARSQELITGYIACLEGELKDLKGLKEHVDCVAGPFQASTLSYGVGYYEFAIRWCKDLLNKLQESV